MEEQLSIVRKKTERKRTFEEVSKIIRQNISKIKDRTGDFDFPLLDFFRDDILTYMHDNQLETLKIRIKPQSLKSSFYHGKELRMRKVETVENLIKTIKSWLDRRFTSSTGIFYFDCDPKVFEESFLNLDHAFYGIREFYRAHRILESYDYVIDAFDNTVLEELKRTIDKIVKVIFKSLMSKHEITIRSIDKSEEILVKLRDEMVGLESVERLLRKLSDEICDRRLSNVQKEMFLRSS